MEPQHRHEETAPFRSQHHYGGVRLEGTCLGVGIVKGPNPPTSEAKSMSAQHFRELKSKSASSGIDGKAIGFSYLSRVLAGLYRPCRVWPELASWKVGVHELQSHLWWQLTEYRPVAMPHKQNTAWIWVRCLSWHRNSRWWVWVRCVEERKTLNRILISNRAFHKALRGREKGKGGRLLARGRFVQFKEINLIANCSRSAHRCCLQR